MALIFCDSFNYASGDLSYYYTGVSGASIAASGRESRNCATLGDGDLSLPLPSSLSELYFGCALKGSSSDDIIQFKNATGIQIRINKNGTLLTAKNGVNTVLGTSATSMENWVWYYVEVYVKIADSGGRVVVRQDGITVIDYTGDTWYNGTQELTSIGFSSGGGLGIQWLYLQDIYVCDTTGEDNNTFIGDCRAYGILVDGAGNYSQWTPSTGSNYECVDELDIDGDTTYVEAVETGYKDSYTLGNLSVDKAIVGVVVSDICRRPYGGNNKIRQFVRIGTTDYKTESKNISTSYFAVTKGYDKNPSTGDYWTKSEVDSLEIGIEVAGATTTSTTSTTTT